MNVDLKSDGKLHEECAVFGVSLLPGTNEAAGTTYNGLLTLQHRGQEGAGIAVLDGRKIVCVKGQGLVNDVFGSDVIAKMPQSTSAVGHTRYSTTGSSSLSNVQPFVAEYLTGRIATAHNGNISNSDEIRAILEAKGLEFTATSDSEVISSLIAYETMRHGDAVAGVVHAARCLKGAFSLIVLTSGGLLIAVRDKCGFRPLCLARNRDGYAVASESCACDCTGFDFIRDINPGEVVVLENGALKHSESYAKNVKTGLCIFEYVYFARTDSVIDGQSVYDARFNMGKTLAHEHPANADIVSGVPDSGMEAAMGFAAESGIPLVSAFVKNRYIGRSFIYPTKSQREHAVDLKLHPLAENVRGRSIVLVDDSIVRGTTAARIINSLRSVGAKEIHMRISSPQFIHTCYYGTDIGSEENLAANRRTVAEMCALIGADSLGFISIDGLRASCSSCRRGFCTGCFDGHYGDEA